MNIPTDIISRMNPRHDGHIIHQYPEQLYYKERELLFEFPYYQQVYWTHFRYTSDKDDFDISVFIQTSEGYVYDITISKVQKEQDKWHDIIWPIPSLNTAGSIAKISIKVCPVFRECIFDFKLELLGVKDLFPNSQYYFLMTPSENCQLIFSKFEDNDPDYPQGVIEHYENEDYNSHIKDKAYKIKMTKYY